MINGVKIFASMAMVQDGDSIYCHQIKVTYYFTARQANIELLTDEVGSVEKIILAPTKQAPDTRINADNTNDAIVQAMRIWQGVLHPCDFSIE